MPLKRRKVRRIALVPTLLTLGNAMCGFAAVFKAGEGGAENYVLAAKLVLLAMVFDALDGFTARLARVAGNFGANLDSLCDVVSFGAAPAYLALRIGLDGGIPSLPAQLLLILAGFYLACTAVRLARFNVETTPEASSHLSFTGLPSPAAAGVVTTLVWLWGEFAATPYARQGQLVIPLLLLVLGVLMISRVRYVHLLNRLLRGTHPFVRLVEILLAVVCLSASMEFSLGIGFTLYMLSGPVLTLKRRLLRTEVEATPPVAEEDLF